MVGRSAGSGLVQRSRTLARHWPIRCREGWRPRPLRGEHRRKWAPRRLASRHMRPLGIGELKTRRFQISTLPDGNYSMNSPSSHLHLFVLLASPLLSSRPHFLTRASRSCTQNLPTWAFQPFRRPLSHSARPDHPLLPSPPLRFPSLPRPGFSKEGDAAVEVVAGLPVRVRERGATRGVEYWGAVGAQRMEARELFLSGRVCNSHGSRNDVAMMLAPLRRPNVPRDSGQKASGQAILNVLARRTEF
jgi:hypothetical protein